MERLPEQLVGWKSRMMAALLENMDRQSEQLEDLDKRQTGERLEFNESYCRRAVECCGRIPGSPENRAAQRIAGETRAAEEGASPQTPMRPEHCRKVD